MRRARTSRTPMIWAAAREKSGVSSAVSISATRPSSSSRCTRWAMSASSVGRGRVTPTMRVGCLVVSVQRRSCAERDAPTRASSSARLTLRGLRRSMRAAVAGTRWCNSSIAPRRSEATSCSTAWRTSSGASSGKSSSASAARRYKPVPPATIGTRSRSRISSIVACAAAAYSAADDDWVRSRSPTRWYGTSARSAADGASAAISRPRYRWNGSATMISPLSTRAAAWARALFPAAVGPKSARTVVSGRNRNLGLLTRQRRRRRPGDLDHRQLAGSSSTREVDGDVLAQATA